METTCPARCRRMTGNDIRRSTMEYKHLGRTGLQISRLGLGTMNFGMTADEAASSEIMDEGLGAHLLR
jgi:hypothetical protein